MEYFWDFFFGLLRLCFHGALTPPSPKGRHWEIHNTICDHYGRMSACRCVRVHVFLMYVYVHMYTTYDALLSQGTWLRETGYTGLERDLLSVKRDLERDLLSVKRDLERDLRETGYTGSRVWPHASMLRVTRVCDFRPCALCIRLQRVCVTLRIQRVCVTLSFRL